MGIYLIVIQGCLLNNMAILKQNGYYLSEPFHWKDIHAGVEQEGENYYLIRFMDDKCFFLSVNNISEIVLSDFEKSDKYGVYNISGNVLQIRYNPNSKFEIIRTFTILSPEILVDENLREYKFNKSQVL